jgi:hypothetical protein
MVLDNFELGNKDREVLLIYVPVLQEEVVEEIVEPFSH